MKKNNKTVFVGISGGVDSSVSAALLIEQGYNVVGVFIHTWSPDFIECTWREERRDAMRVCASLDIPFLECNAEKEYKKEVAEYMIEEYKKGNTPNPDVMCNRKVKFGIFWNFAKKNGADFIATGHYSQNSHMSDMWRKNACRTCGNSDKFFKLYKGIDKLKDQSYFLWTLTQEDLSHTFFPVGYLNKSKVRKLAKKYKIPVATKKDSQGVCFLGPINMKEFLKHYIKSKKGDVLGINGEIIGSHDGAVFLTLGERHGFTITKNKKNDKPLYVIAKDTKNNTITVSPRSDLGETKLQIVVRCNNTNWISGLPKEDKVYTAQIRYHGELLNCQIKNIKDKKVDIVFNQNILVDSGQSIVIYDKNICLGGGVV